MTDLQRETLEGLGVDIEETMERFVENEALFFRCLNKLQDDKNYGMLCEAIAEGTSASTSPFSSNKVALPEMFFVVFLFLESPT